MVAWQAPLIGKHIVENFLASRHPSRQGETFHFLVGKNGIKWIFARKPEYRLCRKGSPTAGNQLV